jgi:cyclophilin family peptidyl-prolyl cis-trans isomerase
MNLSDNVSISSPPKGTKKKLKEPSGPTTSMRLYRAPQSSIRGVADSANSLSLDDQYRDKIASNARRRRQQVSNGGMASAGAMKSPSMRSLTSPAVVATSSHSGRSNRQMNFTRRRQEHNSSDDSSSNSALDNLEAPCLWMDDVEGNMSTPVLSTSCWSPGQSSKGRSSRYRKKRHSLTVGSAESIVSDHFLNDDESVISHYTTRSAAAATSSHNYGIASTTMERDDLNGKGGSNSNGGTSRFTRYQRRWIRFWHSRKNPVHALSRRTRLVSVLQVMFLLAFIIVACDSRRRVHRHNHQLAQYDEERAHILEQMTWIDNAAKKVHKKYAGYDQLLLNTAKPSENDNHNDWKLRDENESLREQIDLLQLRVQQNARDRTVRQFGDKPVQVSLPISDGEASGEHIVIALSDDAPHAVSTFLQQVSIGLWDEVDFQRFKNGRVLQAATRLSSTTPVLEFVEKSRGCRQAGSVAVHQLESDEFHVLVLKIHMEETATIEEGDVCIGTVLKGLETLEQIIPLIPIIQSPGGTNSQDQTHGEGEDRR